MSFVMVAPEVLAAAATDVQTIGSALTAANAAAAARTTGVLAAGADEVSEAIAALFSGHAQAYQALSAEAALFHQQFTQAMSLFDLPWLMRPSTSRCRRVRSFQGSPVLRVPETVVGRA